MSAARARVYVVAALAVAGVLGAVAGAYTLLRILIGSDLAAIFTAVWLLVIGFALALGKVGGGADRTAQRLHDERRRRP